MGGVTRPALAAFLFCFGTYLLWQRKQNGWRYKA